MLTIKKNWNWFLISDKGIRFAIESSDDNLDFETNSKESKKHAKNKVVFDWPWEYEKNWVEIKWIEICDTWLVSFNIKVWKISITHIPDNFNEVKETYINELDDSDILLVNIWEKSDLKLLKTLINKIEARITVFWGENRNRIKEVIENCEIIEDVSVSTLPVDKSEYYILA